MAKACKRPAANLPSESRPTAEKTHEPRNLRRRKPSASAKEADNPEHGDGDTEVAEVAVTAHVSDAVGSPSNVQNTLHNFFSTRTQQAEQVLNQTADLETAVAQLRDDAPNVFLNPMLPHNANQFEISKEIWLSTPKDRIEKFLPLWDCRGGVPIRVTTLCSGSDAPIHGMRNTTNHWNNAIVSAFGDAAHENMYHHIMSCDNKLTARRFIYANSPCALIFHRISPKTAF